MPSQPTDDATSRPDIESLLRTGPETALNARTETYPGANGDLPDKPPLFPPPEPPADLLTEPAGWDRFGTMAIHVDPPVGETENEALHAAIKACLASMAQANEMVWGRWDRALYGCAVNGVDEAAVDLLAQRLQTELSEKHLDTVSIGISGFPLDRYDREEALLNACKALDHAVFFGPASTVRFDAVSLNISGDHAYQAGRLPAAIEEYRAALRLDRRDVNVHNSLGVCLAQSGEMDAARAAFETSLAIDPGEAMAAYNLGVLSLLGKEKREAMRYFRTAYAADDTIFDIPFQIGKLLAESGEYEAARHHLEAALQLCRTSAAAYHHLGRCLDALEDKRGAITAYKQAVKINPNDAAALAALATLYDARGENPDICLTFARQSVSLAPENGEFLMRLAELLRKYGKLDEALEAYESAAGMGEDAGQQITEIQSQIEAEAEEEKKKRCA